ncbi:ABC transporter permease [Paenibacillus harenae]|uniref:Aldouronate transport system permease protein n=1 Tax=Paenibacillus harenae TaxID=306543 RepID=A0ABT9TYR5_PAEHA|nr:ABC transporter permease subunit [Paenibacillus harenae]MDQ0062905.1 putative aldouronate transport system permease protein [Paenibacillus harenae]MDQ0112517.1 putative aldouronate transport system permease protein [Paenibacillus harenae]
MNASLTKVTNSSIVRKRFQSRDKYKLFLMASPFLILVLLFSYLPLFGWIYAFYDFRPGIPLSQSKFMGFYWFTSMVSNPIQRQELYRVLTNTFAFSGLGMLTSVLPVIFAILLTEIRNSAFKRIVQTITTLPNFISWVLVYSFAFMLFSVDNGFVNNLLFKLNWIEQPTNILASSEHVWLRMTLWEVWKGLGWGAILYIAAITGIDPELYEAARVDGAGRFRLIWHVTVPGIMSTYFVLLVLSIASFINAGFDQFFVFSNAMNMNHIEVLDLYVYNVGMANGNYGFATAVSILKSLVSLILFFAANSLSKLVRGEGVV